MHQIEITYTRNLRTQCNHIQSGDKITTDAPVENHGRGEAFSPTDLVAAALGSCLLTIMGIAANTHGINIDKSLARVTKIMSTNPRRIGKIIVEIYIPNKISEKEQRLLNRAAKGCPVHHSMHPFYKLTYRHIIRNCTIRLFKPTINIINNN